MEVQVARGSIERTDSHYHYRIGISLLIKHLRYSRIRLILSNRIQVEVPVAEIRIGLLVSSKRPLRDPSLFLIPAASQCQVRIRDSTFSRRACTVLFFEPFGAFESWLGWTQGAYHHEEPLERRSDRPFTFETKSGSTYETIPDDNTTYRRGLYSFFPFFLVVCALI